MVILSIDAQHHILLRFFFLGHKYIICNLELDIKFYHGFDDVTAYHVGAKCALLTLVRGKFSQMFLSL